MSDTDMDCGLGDARTIKCPSCDGKGWWWCDIDDDRWIRQRCACASRTDNVEEPPPGKHRRPPTLAMERAGEAPCPDCWTPENVEEPT